MTEIFITNIQTKIQAKQVLDFIIVTNPDLKLTYDLNETVNSYPCGYTILRVEGDKVDPQIILTALKILSGYLSN